MADAASFVVSLIDKVSGPAKVAGRGVEALSRKFRSAKATAEAARKQEEAAWRAMGRTQDKAGRWREANGRLVGSGKGPQTKGVFGFLEKFNGKKVQKQADKALDHVVTKTGKAAKWAAIGTTAIGGALGAALVKNTVQMALFQDASMTAFRSLTGSVDGGKKAWESSLSLARELGQGVEETVGSMKHLLAMQFTLPQAEEMVRMSADLKAVTGDAHSAERALTAITQIKAKGKLQAEELVGQLAEAGVSATLVYAELQKSMGLKSTTEVQKAITAGKVTSDIGLEAIKAAIGHKTHSKRSGEAGARFANETYSGLVAQLRTAPQFLFVRLGQAIEGNLEKLRPLVERIIEAIDNIQGDQMARFVGNALEFASKLVPLGLEFARGFGEGFSALNDAMGAINPSKTSMETARDMGFALARAFETAFKTIKMVADLVLWLDQHRGVAVGVASMLAIDKVAGAGASAKGLYQGGKWAVGKMVAQTAATAAASAAGTAAATGGTVAAAGGGATGLTALLAGLGAGGIAAAGSALLGIGAAGASWAYREELAEMLYGYGGTKGERGLGPATPTALLEGLQGAQNKQTTNNVRMESNVVINGAEDPAAVGKQVSDAQRGQLEQFFQSQALEAGAR